MRISSVVVCLVGVFLLFASLAEAAEMRTWTHKNGKTFQGEYVGFIPGEGVTVKQPDGKSIVVKTGSLSEEDRKYVKNQSHPGGSTKPDPEPIVQPDPAPNPVIFGESRHSNMVLLSQVFEWVVTITGVIVLIMLVIRVTQKGETPFLQMIGSLNALIIKIGAVSAILYLLFLHYEMTHGLLSIQSVGFYVAIGSILLTIVQGWGVKAEFIESVGTVVAHKARAMQDHMSKMAEDAKRSAVSEQWFFSENGQRVGPISFDQLKQFVVAGRVKPTTSVWKKGMASWVPASETPGLFSPGDEPPPMPA